MCRYLQWLIEDQDCDDTQFHTLYALSLARTAIETIETGLNYENYDARNQEESNISNTELGKNYGYSVRDRLQLFLQASDLYDPEEVLGVIEDSELWLEKVNLLLTAFSLELISNSMFIWLEKVHLLLMAFFIWRCSLVEYLRFHLE